MRYIWDNERRDFVEPADYHASKAAQADGRVSSFPTPFVMSDIPEYTSPASGKAITSRSARREDLKATGCREVDPSEVEVTWNKPSMERKYSKRAKELARR